MGRKKLPKLRVCKHCGTGFYTLEKRTVCEKCQEINQQKWLKENAIKSRTGHKKPTEQRLMIIKERTEI